MEWFYMPKLNYDKLPYKKFRQSISVPSEDSHGFYSCTAPSGTGSHFKGYHTYYHFGPTIRHHEEEVEKDDKNNEDDLSL